jgi:radical SAM protein with 4Fe4S-binding SPASM domain
MKKNSFSYFVSKLVGKKENYPWSGHIELTRRCSLNCIHCYCKVSEDKDRELATEEWKKIFDEIQKEGCLWLTFTGGDPLARGDFLELYSYAKAKGFIITLFTSGYSFTKEIINYLAKIPPLSIEITLNGITQKTYESITQVRDSFPQVIRNIKLLSKSGIKLILKSNCLKQNKDEITKIKGWAEELLGKPAENKYRFKYDPMIYPRLDGDKTPCKHRLSFAELVELRKQDSDIWKEYQKGLHSDFPDLERDGAFLYPCNSWMQQFFINPYGRLKFCMFSDKFSADLKTTAFREGFYNVFPQLLNERFKTNSKCKDCNLRPVCYHCPARANLETGNEEAAVPYYCQLAEERAKEMAVNRKTAKKVKVLSERDVEL